MCGPHLVCGQQAVAHEHLLRLVERSAVVPAGLLIVQRGRAQPVAHILPAQRNSLRPHVGFAWAHMLPHWAQVSQQALATHVTPPPPACSGTGETALL